MSDIKINNSGLNIQSFNQEPQLDKQLNRSGNFQGQNVNAAVPPTESPLLDGTQKKSLNAALAQPPLESPFGAQTQNKTQGYKLTDVGQSASARNAPSNEALFDFATGKNNSSSIKSYLEQDPAASKAVDSIRRGLSEIGSPNSIPKLDLSVQSRLDKIASKIFSR